MTCVNSVTVSPSRITIKAGEWYYGVEATVCPSNANCGVTWSSDNTAIATVNSSSGYIYAKAVGTTRIYATAVDGSGKRDYIDVTVSNTIAVSDIELSNTSISLEKGENCSLQATIVPENATNNALVWNSSNTNAVTVDNGVVHAVSEGSATITATTTDGSGISASCSVTVTRAILAGSVRMCPASVTLIEGKGTYLGATVCPENTTNPCVLWTSADANIATVNPLSGYVSALKEGTVTIYATVQDGSNARGSCEVTVDPKIPVRSVSVLANVQSIDVGDKAYCTAIICPEDATNKAIRWSSSDPNVATVGTYTGRVTGKLAGTAIITATTVDGELVDSCSITVRQVLTYPDTLISANSVRTSLLNLKTMLDENERAFLNGKISLSAKELIEDQLMQQCDIVRADYISVGENPTSEYAYAVLGGNSNSTVPFSFAENLRLNSTGLAVIVVQRTLELLGYYEPKDSEMYGVFDDNTLEAVRSCPQLVSYDHNAREYVFDNQSFNVLFHASTIDQRTYDAFNLLNQRRIMHDYVAEWCANKITGTWKRKDNKINKGNATQTYYGYADVLKDTGIGTNIWEVKPDDRIYFDRGGIGDLQLQRYLNAGNKYEQHFSQPLTVGFSLGEFSIPFLDKYIDVRSYVSAYSGDARNGLILYKESDEGKYDIEAVPVVVEKPDESYEFLQELFVDIPEWGRVVILGICVIGLIVEVILKIKGVPVKFRFPHIIKHILLPG